MYVKVVQYTVILLSESASLVDLCCHHVWYIPIFSTNAIITPSSQ